METLIYEVLGHSSHVTFRVLYSQVISQSFSNLNIKKMGILEDIAHSDLIGACF